MRFIGQAIYFRKIFFLTAILSLALAGCAPRTQEPLALISNVFNQAMLTADTTLLYSEKIDDANDKYIPYYSIWGLVGTNLSDSDFRSQHEELMTKQGWRILSYTVSGYPIYCKPDYDHVLVRAINGLAFNDLNAPQEVLITAKKDYRSFFMVDVTYFPSTSYVTTCN